MEPFADRLTAAIAAKDAPVCVGLDPLVERLPQGVKEAAVQSIEFDFLRKTNVRVNERKHPAEVERLIEQLGLGPTQLFGLGCETESRSLMAYGRGVIDAV